MSLLRAVYLVAAIIGLIWPIAALGTVAGTPYNLLGAWLEQQPLSAMGAQVLLTANIITIWVLAETYVRKNWWVLLVLPVVWGIGISAGLPLYLFVRTIVPR